MTEHLYVKFFDEVRREEIALFGGKVTNLGIMYQAELPVPPGFSITTKGYDRLLEANPGMREYIKQKLDSITNPEDISQIAKVESDIKERFRNAVVPEDWRKEIIGAYDKLCRMTKINYVPVLLVYRIQNLM